MNLCACGCRKQVKKKWSRGHNRNGVSPTNKIGYTIMGGYVFIYKCDHPKKTNSGYVKRATIVMEAKIGRYLKNNEVAHHKNGKKTDDRLENLQLLTKPQHDRISVLISEKCLLLGCNKNHKARGLCGSHYGKYYRRGIKMPLEPSRGNRWSG